jgi:hypothetical protein
MYEELGNAMKNFTQCVEEGTNFEEAHLLHSTFHIHKIPKCAENIVNPGPIEETTVEGLYYCTQKFWEFEFHERTGCGMACCR